MTLYKKAIKSIAKLIISHQVNSFQDFDHNNVTDDEDRS